MALALAVAHELLNFLKWWMWYVVMADDSIGDLYTCIYIYIIDVILGSSLNCLCESV